MLAAQVGTARLVANNPVSPRMTNDFVFIFFYPV